MTTENTDTPLRADCPSAPCSQYIPFIEIPPEVHAAAETLFIFFEKAGMREWQFSHVTDRRLVVNLERELAEAREEMAAIKAMLLDPVEVELDMIRGNIAIPARPEFSGVYDTGKAMANLIRQRDEARGQRDKLAEALHTIADGTSCRYCWGEDQALLARESLQSLTTN